MSNKSGFSLGALIKKAWSEIEGVKWPIWSVFIVVLALLFVSSVLLTLLLSLLGIPMLMRDGDLGFSLGYFVGAFLIEVVTVFITAPFLVGAQMVALKHIRGQEVSYKTGFQYLHQWKELGTTLFLFWFSLAIINIVFGFFTLLFNRVGLEWLSNIVLVLSFVAFFVFYTFFMFNGLFVADQNKGPLEAMFYSAKLVAPAWTKIFCLFVYGVFIAFVCFLPGIISLSYSNVWISLLGCLVTIGIYIWLLPHLQLLFPLAFESLIKNKEQESSLIESN